MDTIILVRGLRVPRLDRVLDALAGRHTAVVREPRLRRRRQGVRQMPHLGVRFIPTV